MQAFGMREGTLKPLKNNGWDKDTPGLFLVCDNIELLKLQSSFQTVDKGMHYWQNA